MSEPESWIEVQLSDLPFVVTRKRKRLRQNPIAPWELRIKNVRVFYDVVDAVNADVVNILAVGIKEGNRLFIAIRK